ncbi:MAG: hypothetical protein OEZ13_06210 [Spirochaetia bacterium]|nr:hypothetical protein [Spirochaetia bacterium]
MKKLLIILSLMLLTLTFSCMTWFYDCEDACQNVWDLCQTENGFDSSLESFFVSECITECEDGNGDTPPATDDEITCVAQAQSCNDVGYCSD